MIYTNFSDRVLTLDNTIEDALKVINKHPEQRTAFVVDNNIFAGLITDGDIRRALLDGKSIKSLVSETYNKNPILFDKENKSEYYGNQVYPIVEQGDLTGFYYSRFNFKSYSFKVLIMAGRSVCEGAQMCKHRS